MPAAPESSPVQFSRPGSSWSADAVALAGLVAALMACIWLPERWEAKAALAGCVVVSIMIGRSSHANSQQTGPRTASFAAWRTMSIFTLLAGIGLLFASLQAGAFHGEKWLNLFDKPLENWLWVKLPTVLIQQLLLQFVLAPALFRLTNDIRWTIGGGALVFSLLHFPNPVLMVLTLIAGAVWIGSFHRHRRLAPLVGSHFALAFLAAGFCGEYIFNMRVGPACLELFPNRLVSDEGPVLDFPLSLIGSATRLKQQDDQLMLEGWVVDPLHQFQPQSLAFRIGGRLVRLAEVTFVASPLSRWPEAANAGFAPETGFAWSVRFPASMLVSHPGRAGERGEPDRVSEAVELWASNINGHWARLQINGPMEPLANPPSRHTVVLFPCEIDGRIDGMEWSRNRIALSGWSADISRQRLPDQILVEMEGFRERLDLQSSRQLRKDIVTSYQEPAFEQSGFCVSLKRHIDSASLNGLRCFAVDCNRELHPLQVMPLAYERLVRSMEANEDTPNRVIR